MIIQLVVTGLVQIIKPTASVTFYVYTTQFPIVPGVFNFFCKTRSLLPTPRGDKETPPNRIYFSVVTYDKTLEYVHTLER